MSNRQPLHFVIRVFDADFPKELLRQCDNDLPWKLIELDNGKYTLISQHIAYNEAVTAYKKAKRGVK